MVEGLLQKRTGSTTLPDPEPPKGGRLRNNASKSDKIGPRTEKQRFCTVGNNQQRLFKKEQLFSELRIYIHLVRARNMNFATSK